jgi:hypothetical protein
VIGNGNAVGVAGQVAQDMLGAAEGRLEIDHPVLPEQGAQEGGEGLVLTEGLERSRESKLGVAPLQIGDEFAAEDAAEHVAWQEEVVARMNPAVVIGGKTSGWDYAMDVRVMS